MLVIHMGNILIKQVVHANAFQCFVEMVSSKTRKHVTADAQQEYVQTEHGTLVSANVCDVIMIKKHTIYLIELKLNNK